MHLGDRPVLILVDVQKGSTVDETAGEAIPVMDGRAQRLERIERIRELVSAARADDVPVIFVQEVHKRSLVDIGRELDGAEGPHAIEGDPGTELVEGLEPQGDEFLIRKRRYSAFFGTELDLVLRAYGADTVLLVGGLTDVCVHYTAVDAHQHDYQVRVCVDAVGGSSPRAHEAALAAIRYLQRNALCTTEEALAAIALRPPTEARPAPAP